MLGCAAWCEPSLLRKELVKKLMLESCHGNCNEQPTTMMQAFFKSLTTCFDQKSKFETTWQRRNHKTYVAVKIVSLTQKNNTELIFMTKMKKNASSFAIRFAIFFYYFKLINQRGRKYP